MASDIGGATLQQDHTSRRFAAVTTCHAAGYEQYGRRMAQTFLEHWPTHVALAFYTEGFRLDSEQRRAIVEVDLDGAAPSLTSFKARHQDDRKAHGTSHSLHWNPRCGRLKTNGRLDVRPWRRLLGYRWDAVRFAHKVFSILHAARSTDADVLLWIDADTRFFADVKPAVLEALVPPDCFLGYLARPGSHSECGFVAYNLRHPATFPFLEAFEALYTRDLLFRELEFHDSYLFDVVRRRIEQQGHCSHDIGEGIGARADHVLVNSSLGAFMDHMKGDRKDKGFSRSSDLVIDRVEPYWSNIR